jgi:hypothetical protein
MKMLCEFSGQPSQSDGKRKCIVLICLTLCLQLTELRTTTAQVQLRWKVIALLILMEFMIITVYKRSFHINQWKELVCWKYVFCWGSFDGICISCEVPSIFQTPSYILPMLSNGPPSSIVLAHRWSWDSLR